MSPSHFGCCGTSGEAANDCKAAVPQGIRSESTACQAAGWCSTPEVPPGPGPDSLKRVMIQTASSSSVSEGFADDSVGQCCRLALGALHPRQEAFAKIFFCLVTKRRDALGLHAVCRPQENQTVSLRSLLWRHLVAKEAVQTPPLRVPPTVQDKWGMLSLLVRKLALARCCCHQMLGENEQADCEHLQATKGTRFHHANVLLGWELWAFVTCVMESGAMGLTALVCLRWQHSAKCSAMVEPLPSLYRPTPHVTQRRLPLRAPLYSPTPVTEKWPTAAAGTHRAVPNLQCTSWQHRHCVHAHLAADAEEQ
mmetsp:Transcript_15819/g.37256  ORF Transcript_15819/g.37256 Transcript_15819/m.37256 type:complete len:309 (-) Transcript_15819:1184-2110(-)